jgi:hypothetical protein
LPSEDLQVVEARAGGDVPEPVPHQLVSAHMYQSFPGDVMIVMDRWTYKNICTHVIDRNNSTSTVFQTIFRDLRRKCKVMIADVGTVLAICYFQPGTGSFGNIQ